MRLRSLLLILPMIAAAFLSGCATKPQLPVPLATGSSLQGQRIGVAMAPMPKIEVHLPGASCLLCYVAATAMNGELSKHADTLTAEDLPGLKDRVATALRKLGATAVVISDPLDIKTLAAATAAGGNAALANFSPLKQKHAIDKLLMIEIHALGFERAYSSYIPVSDPKGMLRGTGYLVNLATNTYEWYLPVTVVTSAQGNWDEPTKFPGLTNAYYQAIEQGKDRLLKPLSR